MSGETTRVLWTDMVCPHSLSIVFSGSREAKTLVKKLLSSELTKENMAPLLRLAGVLKSC